MPTGTLIILPDRMQRYTLEYDNWHKKWEAMALLAGTGETAGVAWYKGMGTTIELANSELHRHINAGTHLGIVEHANSLATKKGKGYRVLEQKKQEKLKNAEPLEDLF